MKIEKTWLLYFLLISSLTISAVQSDVTVEHQPLDEKQDSNTNDNILDSKLRKLDGEHKNIFSIKRDKFSEEHLLVTTQSAVYRLDFDTNIISPIAGGKREANDPLVKDGTGSDAVFSGIWGVEQLDNDTLIVSDGNGGCLRMIIDRTTSLYAGKCLTPGSSDGHRLAARFKGPVELALRGNKLYVPEWDNCKMRVVDMDSEKVTTLPTPQMIGAAMWAISCDLDDCSRLYFTFENGVASIDENDVVSLIAGETRGDADDALGDFQETKFNFPAGLAVLPGDRLAVANRNSGRIVLLDLKTNRSSFVISLDASLSAVWHPWKNGTLFIGSVEGLFTMHVPADRNYNFTREKEPPQNRIVYMFTHCWSRFTGLPCPLQNIIIIAVMLIVIPLITWWCFRERFRRTYERPQLEQGDLNYIPPDRLVPPTEDAGPGHPDVDNE